MREIVLDIETTGLEYNLGHKIIEIACLELLNFIPTGETYQTFVNPQRESSTSAFEQHGISDEFLKDKKLFNEIAPDYVNFLKDSPIIAHNGKDFDIPFINHELKLSNLNIIKNPIIDTLSLAREKFPGSPANLDALCRRYDIDLSIRKKHSALVDTKLLAKVYLELKGGQQPTLILDTKKEKKENETLKVIKKNVLENREFNLSDEEEKEHKEFIKKIKNSVWEEYS